MSTWVHGDLANLSTCAKLQSGELTAKSGQNIPELFAYKSLFIVALCLHRYLNAEKIMTVDDDVALVTGGCVMAGAGAGVAVGAGSAAAAAASLAASTVAAGSSAAAATAALATAGGGTIAAGGAGVAGGVATIASAAAASAVVPIVGWAVGGALAVGAGGYLAYTKLIKPRFGR